jgi:xanthine dehydrogenase YagR molybdenum-binding subunit
VSRFQNAIQSVLKKLVPHLPDRVIPGGVPDPLIARRDGLIGAEVSRVDGPAKVTGAAPFAAEIVLDDMLYAALAHSTIARGKITLLETSAAERAPGVVLVMTHQNAIAMKAIPYFLAAPKSAAGNDLPVMQDDLVHWNGQPIAVVLAETQEQADHARSLIRATYEAEPAVTAFADAKRQGLTLGVFQGEPLEDVEGDARAALAAAPYRVDVVYRTPFYNHNAIEPHAVTVAWNGDELHVHDATQAVSHTAWSLAEIFGLKERQVRVTSPFVGGGFGGKCLWWHQILAAAASRMVQRPVRLALSRAGVYRVVGGRTCTEQRVAIGAGADGRFDALIHTGAVAMSAHNNVPEPFITPAQCLYASKTRELRVQTATMDMLANTFMRAPGESVGTFALESAIDELAHALGMDPIELRLRNEPDKDPSLDIPFSARHLTEAYRRGAQRFGWAPTPRREGEWRIGMGCATATYPYYRMPGGAARITLTCDGEAIVEAAAHEMGMGTATTHTLVAAERLALPMERVQFHYADSSFPGTILAGGSQQTASVGAAVMAAHTELVAALLKLCPKRSPLHGAKPTEVESRDGGLGVKGEPVRHERYEQILARAGKAQLVVSAEAPQPMELVHWSMHSYGAMFCEVGVSAITGEVRVRRFLASMDCGRIVNAKTARSQFRGGVIMGIGLALMEETQFDERNGRVVNCNLSDYHVPAHADIPDIDVIWTDIPDPHTPMGARGVGEIGITGTAAAVANSVFNATGVRVRDLPITLDKLL